MYPSKRPWSLDGPWPLYVHSVPCPLADSNLSIPASVLFTFPCCFSYPSICAFCWLHLQSNLPLLSGTYTPETSSTRDTLSANPGHTHAPHEHSAAREGRRTCELSLLEKGTSRSKVTHGSRPSQSCPVSRRTACSGRRSCRRGLRSRGTDSSNSEARQSTTSTPATGAVTTTVLEPVVGEEALRRPPPHPRALTRSLWSAAVAPWGSLASPPRKS